MLDTKLDFIGRKVETGEIDIGRWPLCDPLNIGSSKHCIPNIAKTIPHQLIGIEWLTVVGQQRLRLAGRQRGKEAKSRVTRRIIADIQLLSNHQTSRGSISSSRGPFGTSDGGNRIRTS